MVLAAGDLQAELALSQAEIHFAEAALERLCSETETLKGALDQSKTQTKIQNNGYVAYDAKTSSVERKTTKQNNGYVAYDAKASPKEKKVAKQIKENEELRERYTRLKEDPTAKRREVEILVRNVGMLGRKRHVKSKVKISTVSDGNVTPGATIRYQGYRERSDGIEPWTAKELTVCTEEMEIGMYYIWSERKGETTSDKDKLYPITRKVEPLTIVE